MRKHALLPFLLLLCAPLAWAGGGLRSISVPFYSEQIKIAYNADFVLGYAEGITEQAMVHYYQQLQELDYQTLLGALEQQRIALQLNDWLYYELLLKTVREIMVGQSPIQQQLACWFLLAQTGFDTRLTFNDQEVFLNVYSSEEIFGVPMIQDGGRTYVNLTAANHRQPDQQALYLLNFQPQPRGRSFSFYLPQLPRLRPQLANRSFQFHYGGYVYQLDVEIDQTIIEIMERYPFIAEEQYLEVPFSSETAASLLPQLRQMIRDKSEREALEFLVAFTRSSFAYKDDKEYFGYSRPMIADEVLHYPFSDCEDRVALFYRLVRELLGFPMIVIAYEDHLTVGVALSQPCGQAVVAGGRPYYICDPTGPINSSIIGRFPKGYENKPFQIIGRYK